jgi:putative aldouronate transport system substrate-binding protein
MYTLLPARYKEREAFTMLKKGLCLSVCIAMLAGALTGCGQGAAQGPAGSSSSAAPASSAASSAAPSAAASEGEPASSGPEELTLPIVSEPLTLTCFMELDAKVSASKKSVAEVASYQEIMEKTGITIQFQHPPAGQEKEQFNLMLASNDLTDIIYYNWLTVPGGPAKAILDKQIIPLNDVVAQYAPNLSAMFEEKATARKQSVLDDGTLYMFPMIRVRTGTEEWFRLLGPIYRKDWLDKLNLEAPTTIDEMYTVLKAFKEQDPNGNGQADEIPFTSQKAGGEAAYLSAFAPAFGIVNGFYNDNGTVKYGPLEPAYKDYVETMNKWYAEGLIDPEYTINDAKAMNQKILSNQAGCYFGLIAANLGTYLDAMNGQDGFDLTAGPWLTGPAGKPYTNAVDYIKIVVGTGKAISTSNKHVKETVKFLDYFYSEEGILTSNFGREGESYTMQDGKAIFTDAVLKNTQGLTTAQALSQYALSTANDAMVKTSEYFEQVSLLYPQQAATQEIWASADTSLLLPPVSYTTEESTEYAQIMNEIQTYLDENLIKLIMGVTPMSEYDNFVNGVKGLGIDRALAISQAAYDRYMQR